MTHARHWGHTSSASFIALSVLGGQAVTKRACRGITAGGDCLQVCQMEHQLFEHFFPGSVADGAPGLEVLMDPLCTVRAWCACSARNPLHMPLPHSRTVLVLRPLSI